MAQDIPSPMAGTVKEHLVAVGDSVTAGTEVILLESMKMEIPVEATNNGTVEAFLAQPGEAVEEGQGLVRLV
jgi:acetyl-CoA carboxylase biotin carboxyl carrier protein